MRQKYTLCISLGYEGGCVYYANKLIENLTIPKRVWVSKSCKEPYSNPDKRLVVSGGLKSMIWQTILLYPFYLFMAFSGALSGRYERILVFGPHNWDAGFLKVFRLLNKNAYYVTHDGVLHSGEDDKLHQFLSTSCLRNASHLIFLSEHVKRNVKEKLGIEKPSLLIPHGIINYSSLTPIICELKEKSTLLMTGRISYYKGITLLLDALPYLDFSHINEIIIAGAIRPDFIMPDLSKYPQVRVINKWLTQSEFESFVLSADFLLMPHLESSQSGIATVSIGYMKPAIVTQVGAMEEQFRNAAYFVRELSAQALACTILEALQDKERYWEMQKRLHKIASELQWNTLATKLEKALVEN